MAEPLVCAILLTKDRPAMAARAVQSFRNQTYERKRLVILNSGQADTGMDLQLPNLVSFIHQQESIGHLRNRAIRIASQYCECGHCDVKAADIIVHMDDDDWSHPNRIAEQVAFLQESGSDCVGYSDLVFWDERKDKPRAAYLYRTTSRLTAPGTSLCFWRTTWERCPFGDFPKPPYATHEDGYFQSNCGRVALESSMVSGEPRLIASVHGANYTDLTCGTARELDHARKRIADGLPVSQFVPSPEFDQYCQEAMRL